MSGDTAHEVRDVRPIDPLVPTADGLYVDDLVEVRAGTATGPWESQHTVRTEHFTVIHGPSRVHVDHTVPADRVDDDLAGLLAEELFGPGWLRGPELFERIFTGIVRSIARDPLESWQNFYANTLARIDQTIAEPAVHARHGTVSDYAPVYARAGRELVPGSVLELGACFGFLSLRLAACGRRTTASDVSPGTMHLLAAVAPTLGVDLDVVVADAARYPGAAGCADNVLAIHLLEHLERAEGDRVVAEALRLARRRVIIAVPLEDEADETWGHLRTVSLDDLRAWGRGSELPFEVYEHHGGWLVIDKAAR